MKEPFEGVVVKDGYEMLALIKDGIIYHAIIHRDEPDDYVYCFAYDVTDGTWGNGTYCKFFSAAARAMAKYFI